MHSLTSLFADSCTIPLSIHILFIFMTGPTTFLSLSNELILIICTYLGHAHAIQIFSSIPNQRLQRLVQRYCYRTINFSDTSLSCFQLFCSHIFELVRNSLEVLKIGHHSSASQLHLIAQAFQSDYSLDHSSCSFTIVSQL